MDSVVWHVRAGEWWDELWHGRRDNACGGEVTLGKAGKAWMVS
jgi:hypothetical protein